VALLAAGRKPRPSLWCSRDLDIGVAVISLIRERVLLIWREIQIPDAGYRGLVAAPFEVEVLFLGIENASQFIGVLLNRIEQPTLRLRSRTRRQLRRVLNRLGLLQLRDVARHAALAIEEVADKLVFVIAEL